MLQVHLLISGYVQGVGFRNFVKYQAKKLQVKGWVKNNPNGTVEALLQSSNKEHLERMIKLCERGPMISEVHGIAVEWGEGEQIQTDNFEVRK